VIPLICFFNVIFFSVNLSSPFEWRFNTWFKRSLSHVVAALFVFDIFCSTTRSSNFGSILSYLSFLNINFHTF
jgi:hypothetical protein